MQISHIRVSNYKGLRDTETDLSRFVCIIGENNSGKSSLLQAALLLINGPRLSKADYYDPGHDILITVKITGLNEQSLESLTTDQRTKIEPYVRDGTIAVARRYAQDGSSKLRIVTKVPRDQRFRKESVDETFKGKIGPAVAEALAQLYPEVAGVEGVATVRTQAAAKEIIDRFTSQLPEDELVETDVQLPTGIDNSLRALLPEPVYIPAVKDLSDELKTKESTSFGKLLNILLRVIEGDLAEDAKTFEVLRAKLNRIIGEDGAVTDNRLEKVREIEETIQRNLQETFRDVAIELQIPPPEMKAVLSNANILADDGVRGPVDNKGDGFKRAITFSILRSYVQLSQDRDWRRDQERESPTNKKFLFLFEEPELYLHPRAQNILFEALSLIAKDHQVLVTTHSPLFFSANDTTTFIKIAKRHPEACPKPIGVCIPIDLTDVSKRDKFQLISFETSNVAFFSKKIVLVEGDSELIVLPHIAKLLNNAWDFKTTSINLVKINGKGSFGRYRQFFERFEVDVVLVTDLDVIVKDFDKVGSSARAIELRDELITMLDTEIADAGAWPDPPPRLMREQLQQHRARRLYEELREARRAGDIARQSAALDEIFIFERTEPRLEILRDSSRDRVRELKRRLLTELRYCGVYVLEKGAIEAYYPVSATGPDKPTRAQAACSALASAADVMGLCETIEDNDGEQHPELSVIMRGIFSG